MLCAQIIHNTYTYRLTRATETGLMHREKKFWQPTQPKCVREIQSEDLIVICLENIYIFF